MDVIGVMIAYTIGIQQSNVFLGVAYALFDALLVVWMRKPISRFIRGVFALLSGRYPGMRDFYSPDLS